MHSHVCIAHRATTPLLRGGIAELLSGLWALVLASSNTHAEQDGETSWSAEAVQRAASDRQAAERLIRAILPRVRNLVRYLVRGDEDVDDIAQEALLAVLCGLRTYRGEGRFESWVDRVVSRVTFAELPRRRQAPSRPQHKTPAPALLPDDADRTLGYLARRRFVELLDKLPEPQRQALVMHHLVEMTVPEIASALAVSKETIRSRLRLARERLRADVAKGGWGRENDAFAS